MQKVLCLLEFSYFTKFCKTIIQTNDFRVNCRWLGNCWKILNFPCHLYQCLDSSYPEVYNILREIASISIVILQ